MIKSTNKINFNKNQSSIKKVKVEYEVYRPPSQLDIPEDVKDAFWENGFVLKWVRVLQTNKQDVQVPDRAQIKKRQFQKWVPVTHTEITNMGGFEGISDLWESAPKELTSMKDWITVSDVALMKRDIGYDQAHKDYETKRAFEQVRGAHDMRGLRANTTMPVTDEGTNIRIRKPSFKDSEGVFIEEAP